NLRRRRTEQRCVDSAMKGGATMAHAATDRPLAVDLRLHRQSVAGEPVVCDLRGGPNLHVAPVDRLHRRVRLVAGLDGRPGVLMKRGDEADVRDRLVELVQYRDD